MPELLSTTVARIKLRKNVHPVQGNAIGSKGTCRTGYSCLLRLVQDNPLLITQLQQLVMRRAGPLL